MRFFKLFVTRGVLRRAFCEARARCVFKKLHAHRVIGLFCFVGVSPTHYLAGLIVGASVREPRRHRSFETGRNIGLAPAVMSAAHDLTGFIDGAGVMATGRNRDHIGAPRLISRGSFLALITTQGDQHARLVILRPSNACPSREKTPDD